MYLFGVTVNDLQHRDGVSAENSLLVLVHKIGKPIQSGAEQMKRTTNMFVTYAALLCPAPTPNPICNSSPILNLLESSQRNHMRIVLQSLSTQVSSYFKKNSATRGGGELSS